MIRARGRRECGRPRFALYRRPPRHARALLPERAHAWASARPSGTIARRAASSCCRSGTRFSQPSRSARSPPSRRAGSSSSARWAPVASSSAALGQYAAPPVAVRRRLRHREAPAGGRNRHEQRAYTSRATASRPSRRSRWSSGSAAAPNHRSTVRPGSAMRGWPGRSSRPARRGLGCVLPRALRGLRPHTNLRGHPPRRLCRRGFRGRAPVAEPIIAGGYRGHDASAATLGGIE